MPDYWKLKRLTAMAQKRSTKKNISGWLVLNKPLERCQRKCEAVSRFGGATTQDSDG